MPTKRPRLPANGIPGLDPKLEDLLIGGSPADDEFLEFTLSIAEIRALVKAHGPALQAAAARRGVATPWAFTCYGQRPRRQKMRR